MSIQAFAEKLVGKTCVAIIGGAGSGSIVGLGFGERLRRMKPLRNPALSETDRNFASELELTIYCAWRFRRGSEVLCGWRDADDGGTWAILRNMMGRAVESVVVRPLTFDLSLQFESEFALEIFCDLTQSGEAEDNYTFTDREIVESVGLKSVVTGPALRKRTLQVVSD